MCVTNIKMCLTIAVRYSGVRRQFGPTPDSEIPVIEYQMQQWRLIPLIAAMYAMDHFCSTFFMNFVECHIGILMKDNSERQADLGREIHGLSSASKPLCGWTARDAIQECREACGGHGYLAVNRLGQLRDDNDPNCTYEGDNNMLLGQTSNYLLSLLELKRTQGTPIASPLESVNFLDDMENILKIKLTAETEEQLCLPQAILAAYQWLVCYLLNESSNKLKQQLQSGKDSFTARNDSQVFYCRSLALSYIECTVLDRFQKLAFSDDTPAGLKLVLQRLSSLYGLWSLEKHLTTLYQGGFCFKGDHAKLIRNSILTLCEQLKDEAVSLVDVVAPPDHILSSPIGHSNGQALKNLHESIINNPENLERVSFWKDVVKKTVRGSKHHLVSKL